MTGRKVWTKAETVTAADMNGYLMDQSLMRFATTTARTTAIGSPTQGMVTWRDNATGPVKIEYYNGSAWTALSFTSPAQTVQGHSSTQTLTAGTGLLHSTAANTWSSWTSGGTSPGSTSYMVAVGATGLVNVSGNQFGVFEFSLDGGTTTWKRAIFGVANGTVCGAYPCTGRSASASSTVHYRFKISQATSGSTINVQPVVTWTQTAPAITLSAAESLWETTSAGATFGTWVTLGTVGASHRLVAAGMVASSADVGLATGSGSTVIARYLTPGEPVYRGHNVAVPSGALKASGYTGSLAYVLTEPV